MARLKVLLTRRWPEAVEKRLCGRYEVSLNLADEPMGPEALATALREHDAVCPTVTDPVTAEVLEAGRGRARVLANFGVGVNHIDLDACRRLGLVVTNTPGVLTDATAEIAIVLMLMAARRAGEGERLLRSGRWTGWRPTQLVGAAVTGKTFGVVGFGRIGQAAARKAHHGFGMPVLYHQRNRVPAEIEAETGARFCADLDQLMAEADFVSLHTPGGEGTHHLVDARRLALMKPAAFLINTARGPVVDEAALAAALAEGRIAGAGLDVYEREPLVEPALMELENVVLLPHLGSATTETRTAMGMCAADNLDAVLEGRAPPDLVA